MGKYFNPDCKVIAIHKGKQMAAIHCSYNALDIESARHTILDIMMDRYSLTNGFETYLVIKSEA